MNSNWSHFDDKFNKILADHELNENNRSNFIKITSHKMIENMSKLL